MEGCIASPHWEAREACVHNSDNGCSLLNPELSIYLGDWIICDNYENKP